MIKRWTLILLIGVLYGSFCRADEPGAPPETFKIDGKVIQLARKSRTPSRSYPPTAPRS